MSGFVDEAQIHVKAGDGGAGAVSFRREAHVARGGPDGGDGGSGGDVWLVSSVNESTLLGFRDHPHRRAASGRHGQGKARHGGRGGDLEVPVPVGTVVRGAGGGVLADLDVPGARWRAARGGRGGRGNARFLANRRRAPSFAEQGEPGEERWYDLELHLVADVALVGMPNAGKSTLIARISAARPKIADYPFTTLEPHLGVVRVGRPGRDRDLVVADVPGLVEGAAEGRGLGHRFLRHVERARVLVVLLDLAAPDATTPVDQQRIVLTELARYRPALLDRPRLVVGSKADLVAGRRTPPGTDLAVSAVTGEGLDALVHRLAQAVDEARAREERSQPDVAAVVHRPVPDAIDVARAPDGSWLVSGRAVQRAVALSDLTDEGALDYLQERLDHLGVERALLRAGVGDGDTVRIGDVSFTYAADEGGLDASGKVRATSGGPGRRAGRAPRRRRGGR